MSDLELSLSWLDMSQYLDTFVQAGFDSWETLLEVTEEDLESLGIDLGHRRKLQREIAKSRHSARVPAFTPTLGKRHPISDSGDSKQDSQTLVTGKRGYRHHPKPDENAPQRPYSAYVMFSNSVREEMKNEPLSFADISKQVGERWQRLLPEEKGRWKQEAAAPWEKYKQDLADYQKTENYRKYSQYVSDFNAAQASKKDASRVEGKNALPSVLSFRGNTGQRSYQESPRTAYPSLPQGHDAAPPSATPQRANDRTTGFGQESRDAKRQETGVPIPRISWPLAGGSASGGSATSRTSRVTQACEPCRQRKSKCDGERPSCKHCHALNVECFYQDGKKDKGKRLIEQLWKKKAIYEDLLLDIGPELDNKQRSAIRRALLMPPQPDNVKDAIARLAINESEDSLSADSDGESLASGVGSMGSTDHVNEHDFGDPSPERHNHTFAGPASDVTWMQKLNTELTQKPRKEVKSKSRKSSAQISNKSGADPVSSFLTPFLDDIDLSALENQIDPYEVPVKETADTLVRVYLKNVHPSFPMLNQETFLDEYSKFFSVSQAHSSEKISVLPKLQLIFAIAAVHAHLVEAQWAGDDRDHLLYFARSRISSGETSCLSEAIDLDQVQLSGLASIYFLSSNQINRAWKFLGLAIRSAQGLGMHLENVTPYMDHIDKVQRMKIWFSLLTLERILSTMTGRPCMVKEQDCSIPLAFRPSITLGGYSRDASSKTQSSVDPEIRAASSGSSKPSPIARESQSQWSSASADTAYFFHFIELHSLSQKIIEELYGPNIRNLKWVEIQLKISRFDDELSTWIAALPNAFGPNTPSTDPNTESFRVALAILSYSIRTIINRPCLCRIDRIAHQSDESLRDNREGASRCVSSAQAVVAYFPDKPNRQAIHSSPIWWMLLHHIKRAATALLLELSYRAEHMPSEAEEILIDAKKAVNWLHSLARSNSAAYRSWVTLSNLLRLAAERIGRSTEDIVIAPPEAHSSIAKANPGPQDGPMRYMTSQIPRFDPSAWEPMDFFDYGQPMHPENMQIGDSNQFGYYQQNTSPNLFPPAGELDGVPMDQGGYYQDQTAFQPPNDEMWYGFNPNN